jgi:hypothetical protein
MRPMLCMTLAVGLALAPFGFALAQTAPPPGAQPAPPPGYAYPPPGYAYPPGYPGAYPPGYPGAYPPPGYPPTAYAPPAPPAPPVPEKKLGVGYKIGNGLGLVGADVIVAPVEHLAFDLQINYLSVGRATGTGFATAVQGRFKGGQESTPYLGLGWVHASLDLGDQTGSASGFFANAGYEWRWSSGLGIILGGGLCHLGTITVVDSSGFEATEKGGWLLNLEAGLRFMFL